MIASTQLKIRSNKISLYCGVKSEMGFIRSCVSLVLLFIARQIQRLSRKTAPPRGRSMGQH